MWFRQLQLNKKIVICALVIVLGLGIAILWGTYSEKPDSQKEVTNMKTEEQKKDTGEGDDTGSDAAGRKDGNRGDEAAGALEKLQPDELVNDNITDASGTWDDIQESKQDSANDTMKEEVPDSNEQDEEILKDNISWGEIY